LQYFLAFVKMTRGNGRNAPFPRAFFQIAAMMPRVKDILWSEWQIGSRFRPDRNRQNQPRGPLPGFSGVFPYNP